MNLSRPTEELEKLFDKLNETKFNGELDRPMIVIQTFGRGKRHLYGWCTAQKIWKEDAEAEGHYEITICAEFLKIPFKEIATTMLHEMIHLYNLVHQVKDTSNNNVYHNKKFKKEAEARGLIITKDKTIGWSLSELNPDTEMLIGTFGIDESVFSVFRSIITRMSKKAPKMYTFTCGVCDEKVKSINPDLIAFCANEHDQELFVRK